MSVILILVTGILLAKLSVRIKIDRHHLTYKKGLHKPMTIDAGTFTTMDLYTGLIKEGLSQRPASVLKVRTTTGELLQIDITPFTLQQRLDLVMNLVSITSGAKLGSDILDMMNGENTIVNRKADRAVLLLAIPAIVVTLVTLGVRLYYR